MYIFPYLTNIVIGSLDSRYKRMHLMHANEEKLEKDSFQHLIQVLQHLTQIPIFYNFAHLSAAVAFNVPCTA